VVEHLPSKRKALGSGPSSEKKKKRGKKERKKEKKRKKKEAPMGKPPLPV